MEPYIFGFAIIVLSIMIAFVPQMLRFRIKIHRYIRLNWLADFQERHFEGMVIFIRIMIVVAILVAAYLTTSGQPVIH